ncbi:hypothetical protein [Hyphomicrobium sp.]|jgi:hypothetical protein|uniref:hypothetical protein n=1 Tax=Hyphomicrobium sp. TaxID=82 RepID=UPI0035626804
MDPTFAHPRWIVAGILLILGGFWLFRWARRNDSRAEIAALTASAAINKLRKNSPGRSQIKPATSARGGAMARFRNSMAQFLGIVGLLMIIAGLVAMVFGAFYAG